jgi:hypothetical protein
MTVTKKRRVLRFTVSAALIGVGSLAGAGCGGGASEAQVNEPAPVHTNEPAPVTTVNEPAPDAEETEDPDGHPPDVNEPAPTE